jgi:hypothetical protein
VKRVVLKFVIALGVISLSSRSAEAQRSGSMQVTAQVLDTRESWNGLQSARSVASQLASGSQSSATVETSLTHVNVEVPARNEEQLDRPRTASVTINYLRN